MVWDEESTWNGHRAAGGIHWKYFTSILVEHVLVDLGFPVAVRIIAFIYLSLCVGVTALR